MEPDTRILLQELANQRRLMSRQVIEDDVNLLTRRARETTSLRKATKSRLIWRAAVLPGTRPVAVSSAGVHGEHSVPVVFKTIAFSATR